MQDSAFQGGLVAALIALADLQKIDSNFDGSSQSTCKMLGACTVLVVESQALKARNSMFTTFCLETLQQCLDNCPPGAVIRASAWHSPTKLKLQEMVANLPGNCQKFQISICQYRCSLGCLEALRYPVDIAD